MMQDIEVEVACWNRFKTHGLIIEADLVGKSHEFILRKERYSYRVRIELPAEEPTQSTEVENSRLSFSSWRVVDDAKVPLSFLVHDVDLIIYLPRPVVIPGEILGKPPNQYEIVAEQKQDSLNRLAGRYRELAEEVFDLWIRILRWKTGISGIGQPRIIDSESGWSTYLLEAGNRKPFWASPSMLHAGMRKPVTVSQWQSVQQSLSANQPPPTHLELMFSAEEHIRRGDLRLAVIDLAVACEVHMRAIVDRMLPEGFPDSLRQQIEMLNINQVTSHIIPDLLQQESNEFDSIKHDLEKLYGYRNDILHKGRAKDLTVNTCNQFLKATQHLFSLGKRNC